MKQEENADKNGKLIRPGDENKLMDEVELDGEDSGATRKIQKEEEENLAQSTKEAATAIGTGKDKGTGSKETTIMLKQLPNEYYFIQFQFMSHTLFWTNRQE